MRLEIGVRVWRGAIPESRHRVQFALADADGAVRAGSGDPGLVTSFRSAAKPFQLLSLVERGHAGRFGFTDEQLAVMAASHTGSAYHVGLVRTILDRLGLGAEHLACGFHEPLDPDSLAEVRAHPERRSPIYNNCSGKHSGMLALAVAEGWPVEGYERAEHPVQRRMREVVAGVSGLEPDSLPVGVDGCSVSVFGLPLAAMARAYARLATAAAGDARGRALERIRTAMVTFPAATGGRQRFATALMEATGGRLVAKGGAEGLECVGLPARGLGLAIKCEDGAARAVAPATVAVLEALGALDEEARSRLEGWRRPRVLNHAGLDAGWIEAEAREGNPAV